MSVQRLAKELYRIIRKQGAPLLKSAHSEIKLLHWIAEEQMGKLPVLLGAALLKSIQNCENLPRWTVKERTEKLTVPVVYHVVKEKTVPVLRYRSVKITRDGVPSLTRDIR